MNTQTMLIIATPVGFVLIITFVLIVSRRRKASLNRRVNATITNILVEASNASSWWRITAEWSDLQTGQKFIFRSPHINFPPKQRVGELIAVKFDDSSPKRSHMELG